MRSPKNRNVIYTGKVGRKLRPSTKGCFSSKKVVKLPVKCFDGPFAGVNIWLSAGGDMATLPFVVAKGAGRYVHGKWHPA